MNDYYKLDKDKILKFFKVDMNLGISSNEVEMRYKKYGENKILLEKDLSFFQLYLIQAKSFLNLLLLFLVLFTVTIWYTIKNQEYLIDGIIILVIFLINTIIGAYQNFTSRKIAQTLSSMLKSNVVVLRDSKEEEINSEKLVCGDIVILKGGDKVPADCYILESSNLKVDESILTGESTTVEKKEGIITENIQDLSKISNILFSNTFIVSGNVKAIVVKTGEKTEIGNIASNLQTKKHKISFLDEIDIAAKTISKFAIFLILIVSIVLLLKGFNIVNVLLIASALIIGSIPEGLPAIVIFLLSKSVHSLAKKNILVKDMGLLETLGNINILCTDKTGTLTTNKMTVKKLFIGNKIVNKFDDIKNEKDKNIFTKIVSLANEAEYVDGSFNGEPEDVSLINFISQDLFKQIKENNKIDSFKPFSSETKFVLAKSNDIDYKKGAFEIILDSCEYILKNSEIIKLDENTRENILIEGKKFSDEALRLIGFSYNEKGKNIFVGFVGLYDKPKKGVKETIQTLYSAGVDVKMITGDNKNTATSIAKEVGFRNIKSVEFSEIMNLSDEELIEKIKTINVFARVMPEFKEKIVNLLQKDGNRVAITGDGVNDTIALRNADVGVVMGSGNDIAKESADLVLINDNFNSLPLTIREGRGVFKNIRKVINYLLTANLAEVLTIFFASFFGIIPFTAIQILWVNFVTDVFPAMALSVDKFSKNNMKEKPFDKSETILNNRIKFLTLFISIKKVILILVIYYLALNYSNGNVIFAQTISFTWLVLTHFIRIAAIRFDEKTSIFTNKYVVFSVLFVFLFQLVLIYTPLSSFFGIVKIPLFFWIILISFVLLGIFLAKIISNLIDIIISKWFPEDL